MTAVCRVLHPHKAIKPSFTCSRLTTNRGSDSCQEESVKTWNNQEKDMHPWCRKSTRLLIYWLMKVVTSLNSPIKLKLNSKRLVDLFEDNSMQAILTAIMTIYISSRTIWANYCNSCRFRIILSSISLNGHSLNKLGKFLNGYFQRHSSMKNDRNFINLGKLWETWWWCTPSKVYMLIWMERLYHNSVWCHLLIHNMLEKFCNLYGDITLCHYV